MEPRDLLECTAAPDPIPIIASKGKPFGKRDGTWASPGQTWMWDATKVFTGEQEFRIFCTCQDCICHAVWVQLG